MGKTSALANLTKLIQVRKMFKKEEEGDLVYEIVVNLRLFRKRIFILV